MPQLAPQPPSSSGTTAHLDQLAVQPSLQAVVLLLHARLSGARPAEQGQGRQLHEQTRWRSQRGTAQPLQAQACKLRHATRAKLAHLSVAAGVSSLDRSTLASLGLAATTCEGPEQGGVAA